MLITILFLITIYLVYKGYFFIGFIFLTISLLLVDYFNKNILKNSFEELKNAEANIPTEKIKNYTNTLTSKTLKFADKPYGTESQLKVEPQKAITKGAKNFFDEVNELFK